MKKLLLFLLISAASYTGFGQSVRSADPAVNQPYMVDAIGNTVDPNTLTIGQVVYLRLGVLNNNFFNSIPENDTRMQISLDPYLQVASPTSISSAPLNTIFTWSVVMTPGGEEIRGAQTGVIPANFSGIAEFPVVVTGATPPSGATIVANFFVINQNANGDIISDGSPANNNSSLIYRTAAALPVTFVKLDANAVDCNVNVSWTSGDESNVEHYEVTISKTGSGFRNVTSTSARGNGNYNASFAIPEDMKGQMIFIQVKAVDFDGKFTLSNVKTVRGNCSGNKPLVVYGYPNPVTTGNFINVAAKEGVFNGKYRMELIDNSGKLYQVKEVQLNNVVSVPFEFRTALSPGQYMIKVVNVDGTQAGTVQFIKVGGVL